VTAALTVRATDHTFAVTVSGGADAMMILALTTVLAESARGWPFVVIDLRDVDEAAARLRSEPGGARPARQGNSAHDGARGSSTSTQAPSSGGPLAAVTVPPRA
jgi:hypothetical protein